MKTSLQFSNKPQSPHVQDVEVLPHSRPLFCALNQVNLIVNLIHTTYTGCIKDYSKKFPRFAPSKDIQLQGHARIRLGGRPKWGRLRPPRTGPRRQKGVGFHAQNRDANTMQARKAWGAVHSQFAKSPPPPNPEKLTSETKYTASRNPFR